MGLIKSICPIRNISLIRSIIFTGIILLIDIIINISRLGSV